MSATGDIVEVTFEKVTVEGAIVAGFHLMSVGVPAPPLLDSKTVVHSVLVAVMSVVDEPPLGDMPPPLAVQPEDFVENTIVSDDPPPVAVSAGLNLIVPVTVEHDTEPGCVVVFANAGAAAIIVTSPSGRTDTAIETMSFLEDAISPPFRSAMLGRRPSASMFSQSSPRVHVRWIGYFRRAWPGPRASPASWDTNAASGHGASGGHRQHRAH